MKTINYICGFLFAFALLSCNAEPEGTLIRGEVPDAANLKVYLDKVSINGANEVLANGPIDEGGSFALGFVEGLDAGVYQLRIGAQKALLSLEEGDGVVDLNGTLTSFADYSFDISGSASSEEMVATMKQLRAGGIKIEDLQKIVEDTKNPRTAAFIAFNSLSRAGAQGIPVHKAALARLDNTDPMKATYASFVNGLEQQLAMQKSQELIQVGQPAPDISMPSPDGTVYSLSDLRGKVVLLDFWASWCGPCRRENPNVVKVYNKYKDDGFTIYSVSLDGLDPRRTNGMSPEDIAQANIGQKKRWTDAIAKDNLQWPYHVSELTKWNSTAGQMYGVRGIPKTFLIDREGKIAAVGLRGAASIERALKTVI
ncbi:TlpA family protein disulfide reductase [Neolewinella agarilytica]|uniref:Peroxiredoxin n=1 Tax=Neolewinella agarilytica TaxID=478744 RepID=A0A1H9KUZ3_9BACT|nr:TlpA disulfide reductase family protein [Neolewinella agarilytica]SER03041.1 Peroxiredoxin [Neolewinella agarilytica]